MVLLQRRKLLAVVSISLLVLLSVGFALYMLRKDDNGDPVVTDEISIDQGSTVATYETRTIENILASDKSHEGKILEISESISLSISSGDYNRALVYQEYLIGSEDFAGLDTKAQDTNVYNALLLSQKIDDSSRISKYEAMLGPEKLAQFRGPTNRPDEAP